MSALNSVVLIGNLGQDVESKYLPSGTAVATLRMAVNRPPRNGEKQEPDWFKVSVYGKRAEAAIQILAKGDKIAVTGSLRTFSFKGRDGGTVSGVTIEADDWQVLSSKRNGQGSTEETYEDTGEEAVAEGADEPQAQYPF